MAQYYSVNESKGRTVPCPFNPAHVIEEMKLSKHITKCRKSYPDVALLTCPFNAKHLFTKEHEFDAHKQTCPDRYFLEKDIYSNKMREENLTYIAQKIQGDNDAPVVPCEENWDQETVEGTWFKAHENVVPGDYVNPAALSKFRPLEKRQFHAANSNTEDEIGPYIPPGLNPIRQGSAQPTHPGRGAYQPLAAPTNNVQPIVNISMGRGIRRPPPGFEN